MFDEWLEKFFQRLLVVALIPNVLVWGFWEVGIDNDRNPLWVISHRGVSIDSPLENSDR